MSDLKPVAGAKFYIGDTAMATQSTDFVAGDFSGVTWVEVDGWETAGNLGDAAAQIVTPLINRKRDIKQKGTRDAGTMENQFAHIHADAGQAAMRAAEAGTLNWPFRIVFDDIPSGGSTGTTQYFVGLVSTWRDTNGGANTTRMYQGTVDVNSNIVTQAAA